MVKLKFFFLLVVVSMVASEPARNSVDKEYKSLSDAQFQKLKQRKIVLESLNSRKNLGHIEPANNNFNTNRNFRLPNNTIPLHYDLFMSSEIHAANFLFEGVVRINIRVLEASNSITLHSRQHIIQRIDLFNSDGSEFQTNLDFVAESETEFLTFTTNQDFEVDQELTIVITFVGILADFQSRGFIRNSYIDPETNQTVWTAQSHFSPVNARHGFPCYDEIRYRTTFVLNIRHHQSYHAISNMPVQSRTVDDDYFITTFEQIPSVPTYILSFVISNFDSISTTDNGLDFSVFARPDAIASGLADNALELGVAALRAMENSFHNITYPLPKSDQIAVPQLGGLGAHNWGLINYQEPIILTANDPFAQRLREVRISHEYTHIFFGNLVSLEWWTYVWLSEGLGTFYENVVLDAIFPESNQWDRFLVEYFDVSIEVDIFDFVQPMNLYVEAPNDIRARFTFIPYFKAALVLRMFQQAFTEATWTKGLSYYLADNQFSSASPEQLYNALQQAIDEDFPGHSVIVSDLMNTWVNFAGFPVLTVSRVDGNLVVTQEGFRTSHDELFAIPLNYATASNPDFDDAFVNLYLVSREGTIFQDNATKTWTDEDWIIFNLRDTGYYVTNYDEPLWLLIIDALNNDHEAINYLNRGTLFADMHRFIDENYDIRATLFLELMGSLPLERHEHVWIRANSGILKIDLRLRGSELHAQHRNFVRTIMSSVYGQTAFEDPIANSIVNRFSCLSGVEVCLTDSLNVLLEEIETGARSVTHDRCNGFMTANETIWMHFYNQALEMELGSARLQMLAELVCTLDSELLSFYLNQTVDFTNALTLQERDQIIVVAAWFSDASYNVTIQFIEANFEVIIAELPSIENYVFMLSSVTNTDVQAERVLNLTDFFPEGSDFNRENVLDMLAPNLDFLARNFDDFAGWFENFEATRK